MYYYSDSVVLVDLVLVVQLAFGLEMAFASIGRICFLLQCLPPSFVRFSVEQWCGMAVIHLTLAQVTFTVTGSNSSLPIQTSHWR